MSLRRSNVQLGEEQLDMISGGGKTAGSMPSGMTVEQADLGDPATRTGSPSPRFLTTAVVERRCAADNGPTLQALRGFRDGTETAERRALAADHYRTAPLIVATIPTAPGAASGSTTRLSMSTSGNA